MITSNIQICNMALSRIGVSMPIASLSESSTAARVCALWYEPVRDRLLASAPWPFATKQADLQDIGGPPEEWLYRYRYPNDCLAILRISDLTVNGRQPFIVVTDIDNDAMAILTDAENAIAEYITRVETVTMFPVDFADALTWAIAAEIAMPLAVKADLAQAAAKAAQAALDNALTRSFNESYTERAESQFIDARG